MKSDALSRMLLLATTDNGSVMEVPAAGASPLPPREDLPDGLDELTWARKKNLEECAALEKKILEAIFDHSAAVDNLNHIMSKITLTLADIGITTTTVVYEHLSQPVRISHDGNHPPRLRRMDESAGRPAD